VDVVGFSRGAALALHFVNSLPQGLTVRFVGLWDTVPSFGVPGNSWDLGWKLGMPNTGRVYQAMARDESRLNFPLHRLPAHSRLQEQWFRGVHSDVGGGNGNVGLSSIALDWMFQVARSQGVELDADAIAANAARMNPQAKVSRLPFNSQLRPRRES
jgi:thioesterase domain-containing protein